MESRLILPPRLAEEGRERIGLATKRWLAFALEPDLKRRVEIVLRGGPYCDAVEVLRLLRRHLTLDDLDDFLIAGQSFHRMLPAALRRTSRPWNW